MKGIDAWRLISPLIGNFIGGEELIKAYVLTYRALTEYDDRRRIDKEEEED